MVVNPGCDGADASGTNDFASGCPDVAIDTSRGPCAEGDSGVCAELVFGDTCHISWSLGIVEWATVICLQHGSGGRLSMGW